MFHPIHVDYNLNLLVVRSAAEVKTEDVLETISKVEKLSEETGINKALLDLRDVVSIPPMAEMYEISTRLPRGVWVAAVIDGGHLLGTEFEFAEMVAKNRGGSFRIFRLKDEAIEWLQNI